MKRKSHLRESNSITSHCVPRPYCQHVTLVILENIKRPNFFRSDLPNKVFKHCCIVDESVKAVLFQRLNAQFDRLLVEVLAPHVTLHLWEVFLQNEVGCPVGCRSKSEVGFRRLRHAQARVVDAREVEILLPGYHEGGQVGRVDGEEDQGEESPDVGHEAGGDALGAVHVDGGLEEHHPDQPHCAHQREVALGVGEAHVVSLVMRSGLVLDVL